MTLAIINDWDEHFHSLRVIQLMVGCSQFGRTKIYATLVVFGYGFQLRSR